MGIFADFLAARPMRIPEEREARREIEQLRDQGDADEPAGFTGRTGWSVLKELGLTDQAAPPTIGQLLGYVRQDIDYGQFPVSPGTAKVIANQTAIEDGQPGLEQDLLIHLNLCVSNPGEMCLNTPALPAVWPDIGAVELTADDYVHRWSADEQLTMSDEDLVTSVTNGGSGAPNNLFAVAFEQGTFKEDILNGLPVFRIARPNDGVLESTSNVTLFPAKRGTYVWLGVLREAFDFGAKILSHIGTNDDSLLVTDAATTTGAVETANDLDTRVVVEVGPPKELAINVPHLMILMRDSDTSMRLRRNGVEKSGAVISDYTPVSAKFKCANVAGGGSSLSIDHDLAMVLAYDRVLSAGEITTLESELMTAYGVS